MAHGTVTFIDYSGTRATLLDGAISNPNLVTANQSSIETDTTGFTTVSSTLTRSNEVTAKYGSYELKCVTSNATAVEGFEVDETTVAANSDLIASVWLRGAAGTEVVRLRLEERTAGASVGFFDSAEVTLSTTWTRYQVHGKFGATGVRARIRVVSLTQSAKTFYADGIQLELANTEKQATLWHVGGATTVEGPWVELPLSSPVRTVFATTLEEGASDATVDILVHDSATRPDDVSYTGAATAQTLNTTTQAATITNSYRWMKAKKTQGTTPIATTVTVAAGRYT